jgi:hypothetical protein
MKIEGILMPPKGKNKYWGVTIPLIGVHTQGKSKKDAYAMAIDAIESLVNKSGFSASCKATGEYSFLIGSEDTPTFTAFVLSRMRAASHLTARAVAKAMKSTSPNAYARYENGKTVPKLDTLEALLRAIDPRISVVLKAG